jgi:hypothetical protein
LLEGEGELEIYLKLIGWMEENFDGYRVGEKEIWKLKSRRLVEWS